MTGPTKLWVPTQSFRAWSVRVTNWSLQLKIPWRAEHVSFHAQRSHIFLSNISLSTTNNTNSTCLDFADKTPKKHAKTHLSIPALCCISFSPLIDCLSFQFAFYKDKIHHFKRYFFFGHYHFKDNRPYNIRCSLPLLQSNSMKIFLLFSN